MGKMLTRDELQARLDRLKSSLPAMIGRYPDDGDFWPEFSGVADDIADKSCPDDQCWVYDCIDVILRDAGKVSA